MNNNAKIIISVAVGAVSLLAIGCIALVTGLFLWTGNLTTVADDFFTAIQNDDIDTAYTYLSSSFQDSTSPDELQGYLVANNLSDYQDSRWSSRSVENNQGRLEGSVTTTSGEIIPLSINLIEQEDGWKIDAIQGPSALQDNTDDIALPSETEQVTLVTESMSVFADAVNDQSMVVFHNYISDLWQQQITPEELDNAFGAFYGFDGDLSVLEQLTPEFDEQSYIDADGVLYITGHYPTEPSRVYFEQAYVYEGLGWKLISFSVNIN